MPFVVHENLRGSRSSQTFNTFHSAQIDAQWKAIGAMEHYRDVGHL